MCKAVYTTMCKVDVATSAKEDKSIWHMALKEVEEKLNAARKRVRELESARNVFRKKVNERASWPDHADNGIAAPGVRSV